jgi:hypothetical protein
MTPDGLRLNASVGLFVFAAGEEVSGNEAEEGEDGREEDDREVFDLGDR